ncbi:MAG: IS1 family transposase [Alphaproteobacteria bacterium]|nr:IS1 family transposase [Alphaproteobacteria bacterium]
MNIKCPKCGNTKVVRCGRVFGWQRHKCKSCGYQFTKISPAGKPLYIKLVCHSLYLSGMSMRKIATIVGVTAQSISRWVKKWHPAYMADRGEQEMLFSADKNSLLDCLQIEENDELLVSSSYLPSGAVYNIIIRLPRK